MNKDDNIFLIALLITVVFLLFSVFALFVMKEGEKDKRLTLQKQFDTLTTEKQVVEGKLKEMEITHAQALSNIKFQEEKIAMLSKSINDEKAINNTNTTKIQEKEFEIQRLKTKVDEVLAEKRGALMDLEKLNERHLNMKFQMENLMKTKEELEKKAKEVAEQEGVSLGTVVIKQSSS